MEPDTLFEKLGGQPNGGFPHIHSPVFRTQTGTPYLRHAGVVLISKPDVDIRGLAGFLEGFDDNLGFPGYLDDPTELTPAATLLKTAGQTCYASFGPRRTTNENASRYFANLSSSGHGSVYEHAVFSFLLYGVSRAISHEIVRHRAGTAFSQLSQRFVSGRVLRFVERPEYQDIPSLHKRFEHRIDRLAREYQEVADELYDLQAGGDPRLFAEARTDLRKRVQQSARSVLPNEAETLLVLSANVRSWRHMIEARTDPHAESEIRDLYFRIFLCLRSLDPVLFGDYDIRQQPDGTYALQTDWKKV
ncbi:MAG TPA: FAD-dependent thymidylate synthase [Actinomycetota bacterium]|jgi:thymidylate synthase (FAD)|nr:FAD-dependent thymidylate synthase [Actinomycetota bacterium]